MANSLVGYVTEHQTIERWPCWLVFDILVDSASSQFKLIDLPENSILLDAFINVYVAGVYGTSGLASLRRTDGSTPVNMWVGTADNLSSVAKDLGTHTPQAPLAVTDEWLEVNATIVGAITSGAQAQVCCLMMRSSY